MPGRPFLRRVAKKIEELGGDDWFMGQVSDGVPMKRLAAQIGCSRPYLYNWIKSGGEEREAAYQKAREMSAHAYVEDGLEILDDLAEEDKTLDPAEVSLARERASYRKWYGGVLNKRAYGDDKGAAVNITLSVGEQHLAALMGHGRPVETPRPLPVPEADYEVLPSGDAEEGDDE